MTQGYLLEIFSSFQGEGGSVRGSCLGKRQVFVRLSGCNLRCVWCDTPESWPFKAAKCKLQKKPDLWDFSVADNPLSLEQVIDWIGKLATEDLHSISFTGGEPLCQSEFLHEVGAALKEKGYSLFLETAASLPDEARKVKDLFDYVSADLKDESARAAKDWRQLVTRELETIRVFKDAGKNVYAKTVVTPETKNENIEWFARELAALDVPMAIQIVTPFGPVKSRPSLQQVSEFMKTTARYLKPEDVCVSYQMHKAIGAL